MTELRAQLEMNPGGGREDTPSDTQPARPAR
jgi:hypothetical protein